MRRGAKGKTDRWKGSGGRVGSTYYPREPNSTLQCDRTLLVMRYGRVETEIWDKSKLKYREYALVPPTEMAPVMPTLATRETLFPAARAASYR